MSSTLTPGEVASRSGVSVSALRFYDQIGIIRADTRIGGKRRFAADTVGRVNFIKRSQAFGFSLDEIKVLLDEQAGGWRASVDAKLAELADQRERLDHMIELLNEIRDCGCETVATCPRLA